MTVYHFCSAKGMRGIRRKGICEGVAVRWENDVLYMRYGYQWVTLDGRHDAQSWATNVMISEDRTAYRWTVEIPESETGSLLDRDGLDKAVPGCGQAFDGWDGSENWRVFSGRIPRKWLKKLDKWDENGWREVWPCEKAAGDGAS